MINHDLRIPRTPSHSFVRGMFFMAVLGIYVAAALIAVPGLALAGDHRDRADTVSKISAETLKPAHVEKAPAPRPSAASTRASSLPTAPASAPAPAAAPATAPAAPTPITEAPVTAQKPVATAVKPEAPAAPAPAPVTEKAPTPATAPSEPTAAAPVVGGRGAVDPAAVAASAPTAPATSVVVAPTAVTPAVSPVTAPVTAAPARNVTPAPRQTPSAVMPDAPTPQAVVTDLTTGFVPDVTTESSAGMFGATAKRKPAGTFTPNTLMNVTPVSYGTYALTPDETRRSYAVAFTSIAIGGILLAMAYWSGRSRPADDETAELGAARRLRQTA